jgi:hypothetical protein
MDRLGRADAVLAAVASGSPAVVVLRAPSPMDGWSTIRVARSLIAACEVAAADPALELPGDPPPADALLDAEMFRAATGVPPAGSTRNTA